MKNVLCERNSEFIEFALQAYTVACNTNSMNSGLCSQCSIECQEEALTGMVYGRIAARENLMELRMLHYEGRLRIKNPVVLNASSHPSLSSSPRSAHPA